MPPDVYGPVDDALDAGVENEDDDPREAACPGQCCRQRGEQVIRVFRLRERFGDLAKDTHLALQSFAALAVEHVADQVSHQGAHTAQQLQLVLTEAVGPWAADDQHL